MNHLSPYPIHSRPLDLISVKDTTQFEEYSNEIDKRKCTDILCIIIGGLFALIMFVLSLAIYNRQHYYQANFPTDSDGKLCGIDYPGYSFVYFVQSTSITERVCVTACPKSTDTKLNCKTTRTRGCNYNSVQGYEVQKYDTVEWFDRNGHFCMPKDQTARDLILQKSKLKSRNIFFNSIDSYILCSIFSTIFALLFFLGVQFLPKQINKFILYVGAIILLILIVCVFTYPTEYTKSKILVGLVLLFFLIVVALTVWLYKEAVLANGVFLQQATKFVKDFPLILINIPVFLAILALFQYVMILELNSIWTFSDIFFDKNYSLYWQYVQGQGFILKFLWIIQAIWGLNFIKESFNFIVSSLAVLWYNKHITSNLSWIQQFGKIFFVYKLLITKHIGSVIACAFMSSFFNLFDTIFDLARGGKINRANKVCDNLDCFFDLVRSEAMPYIAIAGNSYCNAARYCQYLCEQSKVLQNSQSASRAYRIAAYISLSGLVAILGLYIKGQISVYSIGILIAICYFIVNFFVQVHADTGDAILICYLQHEEMACRSLLSNNKNKSRADFSIQHIKEIKHDKTKQITNELEQDNLYKDQRMIRN